MTPFSTSPASSAVKPPFPAWLPGLGLVALLTWAFFQKAFWGLILDGRMAGNDGYMNVVRLRGILAHGLRHGFIARDNVPYGAFIHWTLPFDVQVLAAAWPFWRLGFPHDRTLAIVAGMSSLVDLVAVVLLVCWIVRPLAGWTGATIAGVLAGTALPLLAYAQPGRASHHILQLLTAALFLGLAFRASASKKRARWKLELASGLAAALALWVSIESFPFVVFGLAIPALAWAVNGRPRRAGAPAVVAAAAAIVILAIDGSHAGFFAAEIDRISVVFLEFFLLWALAVATARAVAASAASIDSPQARVGLCVSLLAVSGAAWAMLNPSLLKGAAGILPPELMRLWWANLSELKPLVSVKEAAVWDGTALCGAAALGLHLWRTRKAPQPDALFLAFGLLATLAAAAVAGTHLRFGTYSALAGAIAGGVGVGRLIPSAAARVWAPRLVMLGLVPALLGGAAPSWNFRSENAAPIVAPVAASKATVACSVRAIAPVFDDAAEIGTPAPAVMTDINAAPQLLYWTKSAGVVAGPYQRNVAGLTDSYAFWLDASADAHVARAIAARRSLTHVLICPTTGLASYASPKGQENLYARLGRGKPPSWLDLQPWPSDVKTGFLLYRVRPDAPSAARRR